MTKNIDQINFRYFKGCECVVQIISIQHGEQSVEGLCKGRKLKSNTRQ